MTQKLSTLTAENYHMLLACLFMFSGQLCVWFATNSQIVWSWWSDKPILSAVLFGVPATLCFWYGTKHGYTAMNELWGPRFLAFGMSYLTFPLLTWWLAHESMLTPKTILCIILSFTIMGVQILWK